MRSAYAINTYNLCHNFFSIETNKGKSIDVYGLQTFFDSYDNLSYEPPFTFYNDSLVSTLDYIFYDGNMKVAGVFDIMDITKVLKNYPFFPNKDYGSDHVCLAADFILNK